MLSPFWLIEALKKVTHCLSFSTYPFRLPSTLQWSGSVRGPGNLSFPLYKHFWVSLKTKSKGTQVWWSWWPFMRLCSSYPLTCELMVHLLTHRQYTTLCCQVNWDIVMITSRLKKVNINYSKSLIGSWYFAVISSMSLSHVPSIFFALFSILEQRQDWFNRHSAK